MSIFESKIFTDIGVIFILQYNKINAKTYESPYPEGVMPCFYFGALPVGSL